jgi:hypothetical protein
MKQLTLAMAVDQCAGFGAQRKPTRREAFLDEMNTIVPWAQLCAGTPQGGVVSPILMNLFMHYAFDNWMQRNSPNCPFARYADDAVVHCRSQKQAEYVMRSIESRLAECGLTMHPEKSKVVYCKDSNRTENHPQVSFTFLGFTFRPRKAYSQHNRLFTSFLPGACKDALKRMRQTVRRWRLNRQTPRLLGSRIPTSALTQSFKVHRMPV